MATSGQGLTDFEDVTWNGIVAPAGTPDAIILKLNAEIVKAVKSPAVGTRVSQPSSAIQPACADWSVVRAAVRNPVLVDGRARLVELGVPARLYVTAVTAVE